MKILFNAEVINFPKIKLRIKRSNIKTDNFWKISDETNDDQLKAVLVFALCLGL